MTPHRLLYVVNDPQFFLSHRRALADAARAAGYDVHVAAPRTQGWDAIGDAGFKAHRISLDRRSLNPVREAKALLALVRLYRRLRPELVHHVTVKAIVYGGIAGRIARVPAVVNSVTGLGWTFTAKTPLARLARYVAIAGYRLSFRHPAARTIFQNEDDRRDFLVLRLLSADRTVLIRGSGVDVERFAERPLPPGPEAPLVVFPGRLLHDKGVGVFVDAARILKARGRDARFVLVGGLDSGNRSAVSAEEIQTWANEGLIEWWGHRSDMPEVYAQARIVCLPSRREGVPLALLEASSSARPVVTTDAPGCRDVVEDGVTGQLVPVDDAARLAGTLDNLLLDEDACRAMGAAGRARVERLFARDRIIADTLGTYELLLQDGNMGKGPLPTAIRGRRPATASRPGT